MDDEADVFYINKILKTQGKPYRVRTREQANSIKKEMVHKYKNIGK